MKFSTTIQSWWGNNYLFIKFNLLIFVGALTLGCLVLRSSDLVWADSVGSSNSITITAIVMPARYIIVDKQQNIKQIFANSSQLVRPLILVGSIHGREIGISSKIESEYSYILRSYKPLSSYGLIYDSRLSRFERTPSDNQPALSLTSRLPVIIQDLTFRTYIRFPILISKW